MGEQGFGFPVSQGFHSPQSALLHKARYLEGNQQMDSLEPSDFVFLNPESDDSSGRYQKMGSPSTSPPPNPNSSTTQLPQPIPRRSNQKNKMNKSERAVRYAFKTRSELDVFEDGYKWRKYGKKMVKNSPNPRSYYRCSHHNCDVKKRVERDAHDKGVVITTYEGKHNHGSSSVVYYIETPSIVVPQEASSVEYFPCSLSYAGHIQNFHV